MRGIVAHILDPLVDRTQNQSNDIKEIKKTLETMHRSLEEMDRFIKVDLNLKSFLQDIKQRQAHLVSFRSLA